MLGRSNAEVGSVTGLMRHDHAFRIYGGECECHRAVDLRIVLSIDMRLKPAFAPTAQRLLKRPVSLPSPQARCHETSRRRSRDPRLGTVGLKASSGSKTSSVVMLMAALRLRKTGHLSAKKPCTRLAASQ